MDYLNANENEIREAMINNGRCEIVVCLGYKYGYSRKYYINDNKVEIEKIDMKSASLTSSIKRSYQMNMMCNHLIQKIIQEVIIDKICSGVEKKSIRYITPTCDWVGYLVFKLKWISEDGVKKYVLSVHKTSKRMYSYAKTFNIRPSTNTVKSTRIKEITLSI